MNVLLAPLEIGPDSPVGGKARSLASLAEARLPIPPWFVVLPEAFDASLEAGQRSALQAAVDAAAIAAVLEVVVPSEPVADAIHAAYDALCPKGEPVAVRSSAADEDSAKLSFAGQLESFLFVTRDTLLARIAAVWRSAFAERTLAYRQNAGLPRLPPPPAVIVQRLVDGAVSGVAFSADPVTGRRGVAVVASVWGLGEALVSGASDADTFRVDRDEAVIDRVIATKRRRCTRDPANPEGVVAVEVDDAQAAAATLDDARAVAVARLARDAERHFGTPQDIEWTFDGDALYLLQSRPITTLNDKADPDGAPAIWDNTNIIESYSGVTTPLTFSFIRRCYQEVYTGFCRLMRVPESVIARNEAVFACLLGLCNGRVYYNMVNGYRVLTLLPGYRLNRRFTEEMLGFRESLPPNVEAELEARAVGARPRDAWHLLQTAFGLVVNFARIEARIGAFYARLDRVLDRTGDLSTLRPDELARLYKDLEADLLHRWDAPVINDFFAAIFHGTLKRLCARWLKAAGASLHNDLLCGDRELVSVAIAESVQRMAQLAAGDRALIELLREASRPRVEAHIAATPELDARYRDYLERFGDRCLDELKLESRTLRDDPRPLYRAVASFAERIAGGQVPEGSLEQDIRARAEARAAAALRGRPLRRWTFERVLRQTRLRVRNRENLRFQRTRAFGAARRIATEMGKRLVALDRLDTPRDVFYLTVEEMLATVDGTAVTGDLKALVALRRAEFDRYAALPAPPERVTTVGIPSVGGQLEAPAPESGPAGGGGTLEGIGCCPGIVSGPVTVVDDPVTAAIAPGSIVVAQRTDPGWVMVFPAAAGLLVERGSMLSHSAIVAREMGLPTIVSIPGLTRWLRSGDTVRMDGASGIVTRLDPASP